MQQEGQRTAQPSTAVGRPAGLGTLQLRPKCPTAGLQWRSRSMAGASAGECSAELLFTAYLAVSVQNLSTCCELNIQNGTEPPRTAQSAGSQPLNVHACLYAAGAHRHTLCNSLSHSLQRLAGSIHPSLHQSCSLCSCWRSCTRANIHCSILLAGPAAAPSASAEPWADERQIEQQASWTGHHCAEQGCQHQQLHGATGVGGTTASVCRCHQGKGEGDRPASIQCRQSNCLHCRHGILRPAPTWGTPRS